MRSNRLVSFPRCTFLLANLSAFRCSLSSSSCRRCAACLFSISDLRFCPAVVGACDRAPSTAPNSLRSRPRSLRFGAAGLPSSAMSLLASSPLVRARFALSPGASSATLDCRRLSALEGEAAGGGDRDRDRHRDEQRHEGGDQVAGEDVVLVGQDDRQQHRDRNRRRRQQQRHAGGATLCAWSAVSTSTMDCGASPVVPSTSSWPAWPMRKIV